MYCAIFTSKTQRTKSLYQSMRILIVPDKFKGSLSAGEVASAIAEGWRRVRSEDEIIELPMSDGGDGFGKILGDLMGASERRLESLDAAHRAIETGWRWIESSKTAIIESAETIGLAQLPKGHFHPFQLDTLGLANVIQDAAASGATKLIMGVGGSATNDGGFGMARGLGWRFLDDQGQELLEWMDLDRLSTIEAPAGKKLFRSVKVALDVQNPLLGVHGTSRVYGPQKGLLPENMEDAEKRLKRLADVVKKSLGVDLKNAPGAGAAGGLGYGLQVFLEARPKSGFEMFAKEAQLIREIQQADVIITGEGKLDRSTVMGKCVGEVATICQKKKKPCLAIGGALEDRRALEKLFDKTLALSVDLTSEAESFKNPVHWLEIAGELGASRFHHQNS